jgi:predicted enzyme related to lactoylglutathione lyase
MSQPSNHPIEHGQIGYLQLPAIDVARSAAFYETVFGWSVDPSHGRLRSAGPHRTVDN